MDLTTCNIIPPKSSPKWWSTCMMSSWGLQESGDSSVTSMGRVKSHQEHRTLKKWLQIIKSTLSSELANWELCAPVDLSAYQQRTENCMGLRTPIFGRVAQVDFRNDCATFRIHPSTRACLLKIYMDLLESPSNAAISEAVSRLLVIKFKKRLDDLVVTTSCSVLKCTVGPTGAGTLVIPGLEESDDFDLHPGLDRILGLGPYKERGLADSVCGLFDCNLRAVGALPQTSRSERHLYDGDLLYSGPLSSNFKETRVGAYLKHAELRGNSPSSPPKKAAIYQDERGGKKRRSPLSSSDRPGLSLEIEHTPSSVIEDGMRKKRKVSPDCHSTDSGIGLLSSPGESPRGLRRRSITPPDDSSSQSASTSPNPSKRKKVEEWRNKTIIQATSCEESESSSEDEICYGPMNLPFQPLCPSDRLVDTTLGVPAPPHPPPQQSMQHMQSYTCSQLSFPLLSCHRPTVSLPALCNFEKQMSSAHKCRSWIRSKAAKESFIFDQENDYTDKSDMELDSDTPTVELLVDSEDEMDHKERKLRRRRRKALRKELGKKYCR